ncbi:MAG: hypothetical protein FJ219_08075 [Ignavibacteria bacterium]|nr:hypothetical protein [Ignavibacteria bacterium]
MKHFISSFFALAIAIGISSCGINDHDHDHDQDHDYATTVIVTLVNQSNTADTINAVWKDLDGPGGAAPSIIDTISLKSDITYIGSIKLYNESKSPKTDITQDIKAYDYEHQFFFTPSTGIASLVEWTITDKDRNNLPVGLTFQVKTKTGAGSKGFVNIVLSHYDSMTKNGTSKSLESDIDVDYPVIIGQ